ncbi:MAG: tetraacyldisaccharide 4'-kinase [Pseudomonadota bacterium]
MRAPAFWWRPAERPGLWPPLLTPVAAIWRLASDRRQARARPVRVGVPVICVGNLVAGGAGKTPTAIAVVEHLRAAGRSPHIVTRGYGGTAVGPLAVTMESAAAVVGDEAPLLAAFAPTWVARDRLAGAEAAIAAGADVIVLDDGLQNPGLAKDLSFAVVDAETGFGNGRLIPAGPLREPVMAGLGRVQHVLLVGSEAARVACLRREPALAGRSILEAEITPLATGMAWSGLRVVAFAGIGRPEKFFATLRQLGAELTATHALGDHQRLARPLLERLAREAAGRNAQLVTTEKDAARLPPDWRQRVLTLPVRLRLSPPDALDPILKPLFLDI